MLETVSLEPHTVRARGLGRGVKIEVPCPGETGYVDDIRTKQHTPREAVQACEACCDSCRQHFLILYNARGQRISMRKLPN